MSGIVEKIKAMWKDKKLPHGNFINRDTGYEINVGRHIYDDTLTYSNRDYSRTQDFDTYVSRTSLLKYVNEFVENAILLETEVGDVKNNPNRTFMHKYYTVASFGGKPVLVKLLVEEQETRDKTIRRAYNLQKIEMSPVAVSQFEKTADTTGDTGEYITTITVADLFKLVKEHDQSFQSKSETYDDSSPKSDTEESIFDADVPMPFVLAV